MTNFSAGPLFISDPASFFRCPLDWGRPSFRLRGHLVHWSCSYFWPRFFLFWVLYLPSLWYLLAGPLFILGTPQICFFYCPLEWGRHSFRGHLLYSGPAATGTSDWANSFAPLFGLTFLDRTFGLEQRSD